MGRRKLCPHSSLALPAKQDSYLLLPQSPFGQNLSQGLGFIGWWGGSSTWTEMEGGWPFENYIYIYIFLFMSVCFNFFSFFGLLQARWPGCPYPLRLSSHLSEEYASLCVCVRASLYIHLLLYESVCVCFMAGHWIVKGNQGDNCCKCLRFVVFYIHTYSTYKHIFTSIEQLWDMT